MPTSAIFFEKHGIQGYQIWHSNVKYINTQINKYQVLKKLNMCYIFKSWWINDISYDHHIIISIWRSVPLSYGRHFLYLQLLLNFNLSVKYLKVCVLTITNNKNLTYVKEHENAEVVQPALMIVPRQKINQRSKSYRLLISRQLLSGSKIEMIIKARFVFFFRKKIQNFCVDRLDFLGRKIGTLGLF